MSGDKSHTAVESRGATGEPLGRRVSWAAAPTQQPQPLQQLSLLSSALGFLLAAASANISNISAAREGPEPWEKQIPAVTFQLSRGSDSPAASLGSSSQPSIERGTNTLDKEQLQLCLIRSAWSQPPPEGDTPRETPQQPKTLQTANMFKRINECLETFSPHREFRNTNSGNTGPASGHVTALCPAHGIALTVAVALLALPNLPSRLLNQRRHIPRQVTSQAHHRAPPNKALVPFLSIFQILACFISLHNH